MIEITRYVDLDAGHRVPDHASKCRNIHGHRYRVEVTVFGPLIDERGNPEDGMVTDFSVLKTALDQYVHDPVDHGLILAEYDPVLPLIDSLGLKVIKVPFPPTAEHLAAWWCESLGKALVGCGVSVSRIQVWETEKSSAIAYPTGPAGSL